MVQKNKKFFNIFSKKVKKFFIASAGGAEMKHFQHCIRLTGEKTVNTVLCEYDFMGEHIDSVDFIMCTMRDENAKFERNTRSGRTFHLLISVS